MNRRCLVFTAPQQVSVVDEALPPPASGQVLVQVLASAISPGTEMLVYRGQFPPDLPLDESLPALTGNFGFPLKYGYASAGQVIAAGPGVDPAWEGRLVFAFQPHQSHFLAEPGELMPIPEGVPPEEAVFLPNVETAINFLMDGAPLIGERVVVFGQGIVGLLTTALLSAFPLDSLVTLDRYPLRREISCQAGAQSSLDPEDPQAIAQVLALLGEPLPPGADLVYELSGAPAALDQAISVAGFGGRVVIGSWYGQKRASLDLGGRFHRSRIRLLSSQVSTLAPELTGRWTKDRRFDLAWGMLERVRPSRFITHRFDLAHAAEAYRLLDESPAETMQVILTY